MRITLILLFAIACLQPGFSQEKYGHLNLGNLIGMMPATKKANSDLEAFQEQLIQKGVQMEEQLQKDYQAGMAKAEAGELSPAEQQKLEAQLQKQQAELVEYEREVSEKVATKREELLTPIIQEAEEAIAAVAREKGYVFVFDTSVFNAILFANDSDDLMPLVKAKLGLE